MEEVPQTTKAKIVDALIGWGIPAMCMAFPFLAWIDAVGSFLRQIGWRLVTFGISALVFLLVKLLISLLKAKSRIHALNDELNSDFRRRLEPVPGKGVYRDKASGEIICPRCVAERNTPSPMAAESEYYVCGACDNMVSR